MIRQQQPWSSSRECSIPQCDYRTADVSEGLAIALLANQAHSPLCGHWKASSPAAFRGRRSTQSANRSPIRIEGAFFATLATKFPSGGTASCHSMVYISSSVSDMYLSHESLLNLGLLPPTFPSVNGSAAQPRAARDAPCSCPLGEVAPQRPPVLPFSCTPDNNKRMKAWLLQRYAASTFNTCPHRALPCMQGPAVEIHFHPAATPKACHKEFPKTPGRR